MFPSFSSWLRSMPVIRCHCIIDGNEILLANTFARTPPSDRSSLRTPIDGRRAHLFFFFFFFFSRFVSVSRFLLGFYFSSLRFCSSPPACAVCRMAYVSRLSEQNQNKWENAIRATMGNVHPTIVHDVLFYCIEFIEMFRFVELAMSRQPIDESLSWFIRSSNCQPMDERWPLGAQLTALQVERENKRCCSFSAQRNNADTERAPRISSVSRTFGNSSHCAHTLQHTHTHTHTHIHSKWKIDKI